MFCIYKTWAVIVATSVILGLIIELVDFLALMIKNECDSENKKGKALLQLLSTMIKQFVNQSKHWICFLRNLKYDLPKGNMYLQMINTSLVFLGRCSIPT